MESAVHAAVPLRVGKKMRKRRELDALVGGGGARGGRLLSASSDEGEPWGRRTSRRRRSRPFVRLAAALALCVCVVSAATVLWLFVDVRRQIVSLRIEMDRVSTTSGAVGDALQVCHTASRELRGNASILSARLDKLAVEHAELVKRVEQTASELAAVSGQLAAAPKLADTPRRIAELQQTVGSFGSQITGFDETLASTRKQALAASAGIEEVKKLVQALDARSNETIANVTATGRREDEIKQEIATLNATLAGRVDALENKIQLYTKTTSTAAPTTTSTSTTTTTTTAVPPGPVKPNVLGVGQ
ncbi:uncharacterized protein LOC134671943 isoform X1 [Cydia fagiglandana]|uniref:uncharacterized protein LOC134671943 isoform X1 n=1 Tax=Cydia fagiglandana TaxID=1458189 RepID=UPI002FEDF1F7